MKTKEEVLKHYVAEYWQQQIDEKHPLMTQVLMAMDEYAQQQVKNLNIPAVIKCDGNKRKTLLIDFIGWYLNIFMRDKKLTKTKTPIQSVDIFLKSINSL